MDAGRRCPTPSRPQFLCYKMILKRGHTDFFFDVSDVLITWPTDLTCPIDRKVLRSYLVTRTWFEYEEDQISKEECLQRLTKQFSHDPASISGAWAHVTNALRPNREMVALIQELRKTSGGKARIFGTFNVSRPDYEFFRSRTDVDWSIFDTVFTSHELGIRLPKLGFFKRVLAKEELKINPHNAVYIGHDSDDVVTARTFGMHGILLSDFNEARRQLRNIVGDPVARGWEYLRANAGNLPCDADRPGVSIMENFGQLLILEATGDRYPRRASQARV